jgi:2-oxoglutarate dehydrogenase E1 component
MQPCLDDGYPIRFTGQDIRRGTFSHRHAVILNQKNGEGSMPLVQIAESANTTIDIYDSLLSEEAVLGFEYGYSATRPSGLVIWEAQFGDFVNGAQVVIDQFIVSAEHKWERLSGLVMLLPHGYEGQGPEHSSARLERFLQLCANENIQVCVPSSPAQIYHLLRLQTIRKMRRPLIIISPKSLLRNPQAVSSIGDLTDGHFEYVIDDQDPNPEKVEKVIMCSGKVYYDLVRKKRGARH